MASHRNAARYARRMVRDLVRVLVALCATCLALPAAGAQTVAVGVSGCLASEGGCAPPAASVSFQGVRVGGTTVGLALGSDGLGISLQAAEAFGPLRSEEHTSELQS